MLTGTDSVVEPKFSGISIVMALRNAGMESPQLTFYTCGCVGVIVGVSACVWACRHVWALFLVMHA